MTDITPTPPSKFDIQTAVQDLVDKAVKNMTVDSGRQLYNFLKHGGHVLTIQVESLSDEKGATLAESVSNELDKKSQWSVDWNGEEFSVSDNAGEIKYSSILEVDDVLPVFRLRISTLGQFGGKFNITASNGKQMDLNFSQLPVFLNVLFESPDVLESTILNVS